LVHDASLLLNEEAIANPRSSRTPGCLPQSGVRDNDVDKTRAGEDREYAFG